MNWIGCVLHGFSRIIDEQKASRRPLVITEYPILDICDTVHLTDSCHTTKKLDQEASCG
jgi:hypothetical protein